ncbi:hypothetical protein [Halomonas saccharevitans]|uniref:hypothetical protein n=1 Tax=Halomonas saccharevitans TaxID=416872 RepID=UPI0036F3F40E
MGAVIGAVVGAVIGAIVGTVIGAVVGTVVGAVIGTITGNAATIAGGQGDITAVARTGQPRFLVTGARRKEQQEPLGTLPRR